ncbi:hypothetical protein [Bacillus sp. ISL-46]|nr:hypothetical protein [Bacillus sp. ISL-46]MBT2722337.1 hypothetical protein [Bacillus sp. ISL-46]
MFKVVVEELEYKHCEKCGVHRKHEAFKVKGKNRKAVADVDKISKTICAH